MCKKLDLGRKKGKETFGRMFSQQVARGGRRIAQVARSGQQSPLAAIKGVGQRRCYAEAAQGEFSLLFFFVCVHSAAYRNVG